ncbi:hypothetical protein [Deefgea sp. CFH1-16]|uniref:hypothetical protein n=1 Tax=Deefgea sp. CFH1-16 TaxID=2675457 RepID=UPI0035B4D86D
MLLMLMQWLGESVRAFNVFNYLTLRAVLATITALTISWTLGPWVIRKLTEMKVGQAVRDDGPQTHLIKAGTPTMGGTLILLSIGLTTLLWGDLGNKYIWLVLVVTLATGIIGFVDDYKKSRTEKPERFVSQSQDVLAVSDCHWCRFIFGEFW